MRVSLQLMLIALLAGGAATARAADEPSKRKLAPPTLAGCDFLTQPGSRWPLLWHDEFDSGRLDPSKWSLNLPFPGDDASHRHHNRQYASCIVDDDVQLIGGQLQLLTRRQNVLDPAGRAFGYTEGFIHTRGKFAYTFGYCQVRVKVPIDAGPGLWPAFWMLTADGWPPEDDVAEFWTGRPLPHTHQGLAYRDADHRVQWDSVHEDAVLPGFHTFGMEWGPGYQIFNRDGVIRLRVAGPQVPRRPMYLILNSGVASHPAPPAGTHFPNAFVVDYVRVYSYPTAMPSTTTAP